MDGQGEARDGVRHRWLLLGAAALAAGGAIGLLWPSSGLRGAMAAVDRPTPSGLPVPRYVSLKFGKVNARSGPGDDHRLLWVYRVRGLPVQVIAETAEWRKVCDPEKGVAWVHRRTTDGRRMVMRLQPQPLALHRSPKTESEIEAYMRPRSLGSLIRCKKHWCRIRVDGTAGWAPASSLWGAEDRPQCR